MPSPNPFQNIGRNLLYLIGGLAVSVYVTKKLTRANKVTQFDRMQEKAKNEEEYYKNLAHVRPGFPITADGSKEARKSEFEGSGLSYLSRKGGDRLGFLDRKNND
ncbi:LAQU0S04e01992g1_1 [Lachancea quebecensis]|uniref:LAQU0S04e01992g1_1 n=1 Tax=Lachancea quebecensis TaxID=1654605 RepID=A0A0P1KSA1_9SACH|nr:LAQU0S04e01992g1_1 [Lachancea quebecensis]